MTHSTKKIISASVGGVFLGILIAYGLIAANVLLDDRIKEFSLHVGGSHWWNMIFFVSKNDAGFSMGFGSVVFLVGALLAMVDYFWMRGVEKMD